MGRAPARDTTAAQGPTNDTRRERLQMSTPHATHAPGPVALATIRTGILVALVAAGLLSLDGQRRLAAAVGWSGWYTWLLPVAVEIYAGIATLLWSLASDPADRARALRQVLGAVGLSAALNVTWHLADHGVLPIGWPVVVGVSLVPPLVVALTVHMAAGLATTAPTTEATADTSEEPAAEPEAPRGRVRVSEALVAEAAAALDEWIAAGHDPAALTGAELHRRLGKRTARSWQMALKAARARQTVPAAS